MNPRDESRWTCIRAQARTKGASCTPWRVGIGGQQLPHIVLICNFQDPAGYFVATKMQMRPFDVLYAANAPQVDITKVLNFINTAVVTADNGVTLVNDIKVVRSRL